MSPNDILWTLTTISLTLQHLCSQSILRLFPLPSGFMLTQKKSPTSSIYRLPLSSSPLNLFSSSIHPVSFSPTFSRHLPRYNRPPPPPPPNSSSSHRRLETEITIALTSSGLEAGFSSACSFASFASSSSSGPCSERGEDTLRRL